ATRAPKSPLSALRRTRRAGRRGATGARRNARARPAPWDARRRRPESGLSSPAPAAAAHPRGSRARAGARRRPLASARAARPVPPRHPRGELGEGGVIGDDPVVLERSGRSVRAPYPPRRVAAHLDARGAGDVADLPRRAAAVLLDVEVGRRAEVALAPRCELD